MVLFSKVCVQQTTTAEGSPQTLAELSDERSKNNNYLVIPSSTSLRPQRS